MVMPDFQSFRYFRQISHIAWNAKLSHDSRLVGEVNGQAVRV